MDVKMTNILGIVWSIKNISPNIRPLKRVVPLSESFMISKSMAATNERTNGYRKNNPITGSFIARMPPRVAIS